MPKTRMTDPNELAHAAAFLSTECRLSQEQIADALHISQSAVSRQLRRARDIGCLQETAQFVRTGDISDKEMAQLERLLGHSGLAERLKSIKSRTGVQVRAVRVFDSGATDTSPAAIAERQRRFGKLAAPRLAERIRVAQLVGVTWGSTLSSIIDELGHLGYAWPKSPRRRIIPVSAEPLQYAQSAFTSSVLARRLDRIVNGARQASDPFPALTGLPALIPLDLACVVPEVRPLSAKMRRQIHYLLRHFFEASSTAYREILVGREPLVRGIDILLTSVGTAERPLGFCNADLLKFGGLDSARLKRLVAGDIGGVLLPRSDLTAREVAAVERLNAMWTGIQREDLVAIARRAEVQHLPGIVLVAIGATRSTIVQEVLAEGLCSELIIDHDLAAALQNELDARIHEHSVAPRRAIRATPRNRTG